MTIDTLIHIYTLLKADTEKKKLNYQCEQVKRDNWMENTCTPWQKANDKYPEQEAYLNAENEYQISRDALTEFAQKEWN